MKKIYLITPKSLLCYTFILCLIATICLLPCLPYDLPMQFGNHGEVNWTLPKYIGVCLIPAIAALLSSYYIKMASLEYRHTFIIILLLIIHLGFLSYIALC